MFDFKNNKQGSNFPAVMELPSKASETYSVGEALVISSGKVTKASGTTRPTYISLAAYVAPATGMEDLPVMPLTGLTTFKADVNSDDFSSIVPGDMLTVDTDGLQVTATTTGGVFIVEKNLTDYIIGTFAGQNVGDMLKSVYDTDDDGVVDNSETLETHPASYFTPA